MRSAVTPAASASSLVMTIGSAESSTIFAMIRYRWLSSPFLHTDSTTTLSPAVGRLALSTFTQPSAL